MDLQAFFLYDRPMTLPKGVYAAALTPMRPDLSCDDRELLLHCTDLLSRGCKGIALFGTTGEGASFSVLERKSLLTKLISGGLDPQKIILGNGSSNISDTVDLAREAVRLKCAAFLIAPPSFYKNITDDGVIAFYREIIERVADPNLRVILYHIPQFSGVPISLNVIAALRKQFPQIIVGIKESEGNLPFAKQILKLFPDVQLFVGSERQIVELVQLGAAGAICGIANLYPELISSLMEREENPDEIGAIFEALKGNAFIPAAKAFMVERRGSGWNTVRPPLESVKRNVLSSVFG